MPSDACYSYKDKSAEWAKWRKHYKALGCSDMKILELTCRRMRQR